MIIWVSVNRLLRIGKAIALKCKFMVKSPRGEKKLDGHQQRIVDAIFRWVTKDVVQEVGRPNEPLKCFKVVGARPQLTWVCLGGLAERFLVDSQLMIASVIVQCISSVKEW